MAQQQWIRVCVLAIAVICLAVTSVSAETLTLDQCIDIALNKNGSNLYRLPSARISYNQAKQGVWSRWGGLLPSVSHGYSYFYQKLPEGTIFDQTTGERIDVPAKSSASWSTSFSLDHTLFDGGANWYRLAQAYHNRAAARENLRGAENGLVLGVKEQYFSLLKAVKLVEVQEAAVRRAEEFLKTIDSRYDLGSASLSEVLKARVQRGTEELELLRRKNSEQNARASLNSVLNRAVDSELEIVDIGESSMMVPSYEEALTTALKSSPDVQSAEAGLRSAKDDVGIARATFFPTFRWGLSRSFSPEARNDLLDFDGKYGRWSANASLSIPLFSGFHRKTAVSNARVGLKYTRESVSQTKTGVALAVKQAYLGVELADETRNLAKEIEGSAQQDFNLAQEKYNLGAATILDLLDAQASLTKAQNDKVNSQSDYHTAVARLHNAMGGGQ